MLNALFPQVIYLALELLVLAGRGLEFGQRLLRRLPGRVFHVPGAGLGKLLLDCREVHGVGQVLRGGLELAELVERDPATLNRLAPQVPGFGKGRLRALDRHIPLCHLASEQVARPALCLHRPNVVLDFLFHGPCAAQPVSQLGGVDGVHPLHPRQGAEPLDLAACFGARVLGGGQVRIDRG